MAKITRIFQNLFASTAPAAAGGTGIFGSFAAGLAQYTSDIETMQNTPAWNGGWSSAILAEDAPAIEDFNAVCAVFAYQLAYLLQQGIAEWDATTAYYKNSFVQSSGVLYVSLTDNNVNHAVTDATNWKRPTAGLTQVAGNTNYNILANDDIVEMTATVALLTATLPAASAALKGKMVTVVKMDATANPITVTDTVFSVNLNAQYDSVKMFCNGAVWYSI